MGGGRTLINSDILRRINQSPLSGNIANVLYFLHSDPAFRTLFYHRLGKIGFAIGWIRPGLKSLYIARTMPIGPGCYLPRPFSTILHAKRIGKNFSCMQLTTLGKTEKGNPIIGDNVSLGANVTIIGNVKVGDNVTVGAGSVVTKDVPSNCVVAGVPAKVIKWK